MPNWCCTNILLQGDEKQLKAFSEKVNSCYDRKDLKETWFGPLWLGNVCTVFGGDHEAEHTAGGNLRGCINPDPGAVATLFGPYPDEKKPRLVPLKTDDGQWVLEFSTETAWAPSSWLMELLYKECPSCEIAWKTTDEFENFTDCHNGRLLGLKDYEIEYHDQNGDWDLKEYDDSEMDLMLAFLKEQFGIELNADTVRNNYDALVQKMIEYNEKHEDDYAVIRRWREVEAY